MRILMILLTVVCTSNIFAVKTTETYMFEFVRYSLWENGLNEQPLEQQEGLTQSQVALGENWSIELEVGLLKFE